MAVKSSKDLRSAGEIAEWLARLDREWPQRRQMAQRIANQVAALGSACPQVVELACGSGYLAEYLVRTLSDLWYTGFDVSPALLDAARTHLSILAGHVDRNVELHLRQADLNETIWVDYLDEMGLVGQVDAVVSLQSMHDLGDAAAQAMAIARVHPMLRPGGIFVNADLLLDPKAPHPRRLPVERHLAILEKIGFDSAQCVHQEGEFGLFVAKVASQHTP